MKVKKNLLFLFSPFFCFFAYADCADCEAYKMQVANDCDSIVSSCDSAYYDCISAAGAAELFAIYYASNSTESVYLTQAAEQAYRAAGTITTLKTFAQSIKSTAQSLQCSTNNASGTCDCAPILQSITSQLNIINSSVVANGSTLSTISSLLQSADGSASIYSLLDDLQDIFDFNSENLLDISNALIHFLQYDEFHEDQSLTLSDFYNLFSSLTNFNHSILSGTRVIAYRYAGNNGIPISAYQGMSKSVFYYPWKTATSSSYHDATIKDLLYGGFSTLLQSTFSLNNYAYTNLFIFTAINDKMSDISHGVSEITNQFSIFIDSSVGASPVLSAYTSQDGSYHDYLTNYYIQVSGSSVSGSTPLTNWFNRIEMLLASLVFRDEGTNFVESSDDASQFDNTLSQSLDTLSQAVSIPQNVTGKIDNMGQSFLGLLSEWQTIVSGNSLPSQFVLCDINLGSQNRDNSGGSSLTSFRLETSLDSGELRQFLDFCHAITTILFTMLFVWLSIKLLCFLLSSLAKLVQFCYLVYSALFGG